MAEHVCPWWLGYLLASPLRRLMQDPVQILQPFVSEGMIVLEPGPGMGFFTVELARMVGASGKVVAVDIQPRMLSGLRRRLARRGLLERVEIRSAKPDSLNVSDLAGKVDLVVAFAVIHELPDATAFFAESCHVMKSGASLLIAEPRGHVDVTLFAAELDSAARHGLVLAERPAISRSHAAILRKA